MATTTTGTPSSATQALGAEPTSLYERLGGHRGIAAISGTVVALHLKNPLVSPRFAVADRERLTRLATEFFCMGSGGPETYTGREMAEAHRGMNVSEQELVSVIDDILEALRIHGIGQRERDEVLAILYGLKAQIVRL